MTHPLFLTLFLAQVPPEAAADYAQILQQHVNSAGLVNYQALGKNRAPLDKYLAAVAAAPLPTDKNARMAFYVDAYNALVLRSVLDKGRPRSVLDVKDFFSAADHTVAGKKVSLDGLEKKELNPFAKDPRTHFVLVCGAVGCPILEAKPFFGTNLSARMDAATRRYLASPAGARVSDGKLELSKIFDWYAADFGGAEGALSFVKRYLVPEAAAKLGATPSIGYLDYNWTLNQQ